MRHIAIIVCSLLGLAQAGCASNLKFMEVRNGQVRQQIDGSIGPNSTDIEVKTNHQAMQTCVADTGPMPDGEESDLCVNQVRADKARRNRTLDWQSTPYYGAYGTYAPPGTVGY